MRGLEFLEEIPPNRNSSTDLNENSYLNNLRLYEPVSDYYTSSHVADVQFHPEDNPIRSPYLSNYSNHPLHTL